MPINYSIKGMKRPGAVTEYTAEMVIEIAKCARDIIYFAETYFTIIEEKRGKHIIKLFDYQKEMINNFVANRFNVCCTGRQLGKTTIASVYLLWLCIFESNKTVGILSNKEASAKSMVNDIKTAWLELPDWLKPGAEKWDQLELRFENGSAIMAGATSEDSFRGESLSCVSGDTLVTIKTPSGEEKTVPIQSLWS